MVYCKGDYFEPLCKIRRMPGHIEITKFFRESEFKVFKSNTNIMSIIENIKNICLIFIFTLKRFLDADIFRGVQRHFGVCSVHCTLCTAHCTVDCVLHSAHCVLHTVDPQNLQ